MRIYILIIFCLILLTIVVYAIPVSYDITINGIANEALFTKTQNEVKDCGGTCIFDVPIFEVPENFTFSNYTIINPSELIKSIKFESSNDLVTINAQDKVILESVELKEELKIGRLITKNLSPGQNNIVLQLENIGNKDLKNVYIQISGDGVKTGSKSSIDIPTGQSDFVTAIIQVINYGDIDIIIKAYSNEKLLGQTIETISVPEPEKIETKKEEIIYVDQIYAREEINRLWNKLNEYEKEYLSKKAQEYEIADIESDINNIKEEIGKLELDSSTLTKEVFDKEVSVLKRSLENIKTQIDFAQPKKFTDKIKEHLGLIATGLGVIVSSLTALGLAKSHIGKGKGESKVNKFGIKKK